MPQRTPVSKLGPLQPGLEPEVRDLAIFLREQFDLLGMSVRAYAKQHKWEPGTVSRFLNGARIPTPYFVDDLVADAGTAADAGTQRLRGPGEDQWNRGRDLRTKA